MQVKAAAQALEVPGSNHETAFERQGLDQLHHKMYTPKCLNKCILSLYSNEFQKLMSFKRLAFIWQDKNTALGSICHKKKSEVRKLSKVHFFPLTQHKEWLYIGSIPWIHSENGKHSSHLQNGQKCPKHFVLSLTQQKRSSHISSTLHLLSMHIYSCTFPFALVMFIQALLNGLDASCDEIGMCT